MGELTSLRTLLNQAIPLSETAKQYFDAAMAEREKLGEEEYGKLQLQRECDRYNSEAGALNADGIYDCPDCKNRGFFMAIEDGRTVLTTCKCMNIRQTVLNMRRSGLENVIGTLRFDNFSTDTEWRRVMLEKAKDYAENGASSGQWLFIGGAVGSGKTHLCTAVVRKLLGQGKTVRYISWTTVSADMKAKMYDAEAYAEVLNDCTGVDVLYIDDFFKPVAGLDPTPTDIRLAYEIINKRYAERKPTIISSERYLKELQNIDEAVSSRIYEMTGRYAMTITREAGRNYRMRHEQMI